MLPQNISGRQKLNYFLISYFNYNYYLLCCPFRLHFKSGKNNIPLYELKSCFLNKLLCAFLTCLNVLQTLNILKTSLPKDVHDPKMYLIMTFLGASSLYKLVAIKNLWRNQEDILKIVNFLINPKNPIPIPHATHFMLSWKGKLVMISFCILYPLVWMCHWVVGRSTISHPSAVCDHEINRMRGIEWLWTTAVISGRENFFMGNGNVTTADMHKWTLFSCRYPFSVAETIMGVLFTLGFYSRIVIDFGLEVLLIIISCTLNMIVRAFVTNLKQGSASSDNKSENEVAVKFSKSRKHISIDMEESGIPRNNCWEEVHAQYEAIKELTHLINHTWGWNLFLFLVSLILYYSVSFDEIFFRNSFPQWGKIIPTVFFFCSSCLILVLAADVAVQVR